MLRCYFRQNAEVCTRPKATDTTTEYVIRTAFSLQQWLYERDSVLRYRTLPVWFMIPKLFNLCCGQGRTKGKRERSTNERKGKEGIERKDHTKRSECRRY